jgi:hypothetical protein
MQPSRSLRSKSACMICTGVVAAYLSVVCLSEARAGLGEAALASLRPPTGHQFSHVAPAAAPSCRLVMAYRCCLKSTPPSNKGPGMCVRWGTCYRCD